MSDFILRPRAGAAFCGMGYSTFNDARIKDPDFQDLKVVPLGERAIGFFRDDLLKIIYRKTARRDGVPEHLLDEEANRLLIEERTREQLVVEACERLERKARTDKRRKAKGEVRCDAPPSN